MIPTAMLVIMIIVMVLNIFLYVIEKIKKKKYVAMDCFLQGGTLLIFIVFCVLDFSLPYLLLVLAFGAVVAINLWVDMEKIKKKDELLKNMEKAINLLAVKATKNAENNQ